MKKTLCWLMVSVFCLSMVMFSGTMTAESDEGRVYYEKMLAKLDEVSVALEDTNRGEVSAVRRTEIEEYCEGFIDEIFLAAKEQRYPSFDEYYLNYSKDNENLMVNLLTAAAAILKEQKLYETVTYKLDTKIHLIEELSNQDTRVITQYKSVRELSNAETHKKRSIPEICIVNCEFILRKNGTEYKVISYIPITDVYYSNLQLLRKSLVLGQIEEAAYEIKLKQWENISLREIATIYEDESIHDRRAYPNLVTYSSSMRNGAVSYARTYYLNYNPAYYDYESTSGGDCANFVSQCLNEGAGIPVDTIGNSDTVKWNKKLVNGIWQRDTASWSGASSQFNYFRYNDSASYAGTIGGMSANTGTFSSISAAPTSLRIGDVVYHASSSSSSPYHATIIVGFEYGSSDSITDILYSAHTSEVYGASLASRLLDGVVARYAHINGYY